MDGHDFGESECACLPELILVAKCYTIFSVLRDLEPWRPLSSTYHLVILGERHSACAHVPLK